MFLKISNQPLRDFRGRCQNDQVAVEGADLRRLAIGPTHFDIEKQFVLILFFDPGDDPLEGLVSNPAKHLVAQFAVKTLCFHDAVLFGPNPTQIPDSPSSGAWIMRVLIRPGRSRLCWLGYAGARAGMLGAAGEAVTFKRFLAIFHLQEIRMAAPVAAP